MSHYPDAWDDLTEEIEAERVAEIERSAYARIEPLAAQLLEAVLDAEREGAEAPVGHDWSDFAAMLRDAKRPTDAQRNAAAESVRQYLARLGVAS